MNKAISPIKKENTISPEAQRVKAALLAAGLETPMQDTQLSNEEKYLRIQGLMEEVISTLGLDLTDDSLAETPHRIAKMYVHEVFSGLDYSSFPKIALIENKMAVDEMIKVSDIDMTSTCEHHLIRLSINSSEPATKAPKPPMALPKVPIIIGSCSVVKPK